MDEKKQKELIYRLEKYSSMANQSWGQDEKEHLHNYWKGQVMGMCKVIDAFDLPIDTEYYLKNLL